MKIDPNQTPQPNGSPEQPTDPARAPGTAAPGTPAGGTAATDNPKSSPFFNLLSKGRRGEGESLKGGEAGDLMGEKGKLGGAFTTSPETGVSSDPKGAVDPRAGTDPRAGADLRGGWDAKGGPRGGLNTMPGRNKMSGLKGEQQPGEGKTGGQVPGMHRPHLHGPNAAAGGRYATPETSSKPGDFGGGRNALKQPDSKRNEGPALDQKTTTPVTAPNEAPALRGLSEQPAVSQVHATGSTADVERLQALTQEMVEKLQTTKGPGGDDQVDIQFNSRTLQGLQVSISRNEAGVSIRFNTASEPVTQLLSQNVQTLVQALAAKGVEVGDVRVVPTTTSSSETFNNSGGGSRQESRQGGRGGSGGYSGGSSEGGSSGGGQRGGR